MSAQVHVDDVIALYLLIFKSAIAGRPTSSPYSRYFIADARIYGMKSIATEVARILHQSGKMESPEAVSISFEDAGPLAL